MGMYDCLSLGTFNTTVTAFKNMVDERLGISAAINAAEEASEFGLNLYMKALKLQECQNIAFDYIDSVGTKLIGNFNGLKIYKDFAGTIATTVSNTAQQFGKAILDNQNLDFSLFENVDTSFIMSLSDFSVEPLISDFTSLYQMLLTEGFEKLETYNDDIQLTSSLFVTFGSYLSSAIIYNETNKNPDNYLSSIDAFKSDALPNNDTLLPVVTGGSVIIPNIANGDVSSNKVKDVDVSNYGTQEAIANIASEVIDGQSNILTKNVNQLKPSDLSSVQAIIFDIDHKLPILKCWQLPESISYSASAQFDSVATRGTQQPFQFYNCANQISLSFNLKWHIDELYVYDEETREVKLASDYQSLQEIATAAEAFTRPYYEDNSLKPKVCGVILPSISQIGYITEAQISYSGAVTAAETSGKSQRDLSTFEKMALRASEESYLSGTDLDVVYAKNNETYEYSVLEISFQLLIIKDVDLVSSKKNDDDDRKRKEEAEAKEREEAANKKLAEDIMNAEDSVKEHLDADKMQSVMPAPPESEEQISSSVEQYTKTVIEGYGTDTPVNGQGR